MHATGWHVSKVCGIHCPLTTARASQCAVVVNTATLVSHFMKSLQQQQEKNIELPSGAAETHNMRAALEISGQLKEVLINSQITLSVFLGYLHFFTCACSWAWGRLRSRSNRLLVGTSYGSLAGGKAVSSRGWWEWKQRPREKGQSRGKSHR